MNPLSSPPLTDLYQLNMIQAYLDHAETKTAVFKFFVRKLPERRGFLVAAGLEQALQFLENLHFSAEEIVTEALIKLAADVDHRLAQSERAAV